jgi:serine/threonine protein kinase
MDQHYSDNDVDEVPPSDDNDPISVPIDCTYAEKRDVPYGQVRDSREFFGGQGKVFKATKESNIGSRSTYRETFAVKELQPKDKDARRRLKNEIAHLRRCSHQNVIRLREVYSIGADEWSNMVFLVTQPWAAASLGRFIGDLKNQQFRVNGESSQCSWYKPQILTPWPGIIRQCILGVQYLHQELGLKHKNLTPDNILLLDESNGDYDHPRIRPVIADLGISKADKSNEPTTGIGTGRYMAPEQKRKDRPRSLFASDIFSLGCCFSWIQAILSSKLWIAAEGDEQGVLKLDRLTLDGFAEAAERSQVCWIR